MQKKGICVFAANLMEGLDSYEATAGNHLLGNLPPDSIITDAYIHVLTASDATAATGKLGTTSNGTQILGSSNLKTLGKQGTFAGQTSTGSGTEVWLGTTATGTPTNTGSYVVVVEYLEYTKNTGEYTQV